MRYVCTVVIGNLKLELRVYIKLSGEVMTQLRCVSELCLCIKLK